MPLFYPVPFHFSTATSRAGPGSPNSEF